MAKELNITMLGASGVGKTTLLTSMYEQFEATSRQANLHLKPDIETAAILERYLAQLKSLTYEFKADERTKGIRGTLGKGVALRLRRRHTNVVEDDLPRG